LSVTTEKFRASYGFSKAEKIFSGYPVAGDSDSYSSRKLIAVITTEMKVHRVFRHNHYNYFIVSYNKNLFVE